MAQLFFLVLIICVPIAVAVVRTSPYRVRPTFRLTIEPLQSRWTPTRRMNNSLDHKQWAAWFEEELRRAGGPQGE